MAWAWTAALSIWSVDIYRRLDTAGGTALTRRVDCYRMVDVAVSYEGPLLVEFSSTACFGLLSIRVHVTYGIVIPYLTVRVWYRLIQDGGAWSLHRARDGARCTLQRACSVSLMQTASPISNHNI